MKTSLLLLLSATLAMASGADDCVTYAKIDSIRDFLRPLLVGRLAAHVVRAVFHDSVGGSDGCLNRLVDANSGNPGPGNFMNIVGVLDHVYDRSYADSGLSRADFYVLSGEVAIENAFILAELNHGNCANELSCRELFRKKVDLGFMFGRKDCDTSPIASVERDFPHGHLDGEGVFDFFSDMYGMSVRESVAILGAHTLGRTTGFQGWEGIWVESEEDEIRFDNLYYFSLALDQDIIFTNQTRMPDFKGEKRFQWNGLEAEDDGTFEIYIMLNADMAMLKEIVVDVDGVSSCDFSTCEDSIGADHVIEFAKDNDAWLEAFSKAWQKMVTVGTKGDLKKPKPNFFPLW